MKTAILTPNQKIVASFDAPTTATCPACGGIVILTYHARQMDGESWYWRHARGGDSTCPARSKTPGM